MTAGFDALLFNVNKFKQRRVNGGRKCDYIRLCRAGCERIEIINHIVQQCHHTHDMRIKRHNEISNYLKMEMNGKDYNVIEKPRFNTDEGLRKPDLLVVKVKTGFIFDAQIMSLFYTSRSKQYKDRILSR